jgi:lycopene cyclase domain-containing protein
MATYLLVNLIFIIGIVMAFRLRPRKPSKAIWLSLIALLILTAVFDSLIVGFGIVGYDTEKILGVYVGNAPIEDFFYAVMALLIVVVVWNKLGTRHAE